MKIKGGDGLTRFTFFKRLAEWHYYGTYLTDPVKNLPKEINTESVIVP